jgi:hypothetical protein
MTKTSLNQLKVNQNELVASFPYARKSIGEFISVNNPEEFNSSAIGNNYQTPEKAKVNQVRTMNASVNSVSIPASSEKKVGFHPALISTTPAKSVPRFTYDETDVGGGI